MFFFLQIDYYMPSVLHMETIFFPDFIYSAATFGNSLLCLPEMFSEMNNPISSTVSSHTVFLRPQIIIFCLA